MLTCRLAGRLLRLMRIWVALLLAGILGVTGCGRKHQKAPPPAFTTGPNKMIVTPETALAGKVVRVNPEGRFVVLNFPIGRLPALDQRLSIYRLGLKVGEVRVTGPQLDDNVVADLVAGDARSGDDVRDR